MSSRRDPERIEELKDHARKKLDLMLSLRPHLPLPAADDPRLLRRHHHRGHRLRLRRLPRRQAATVADAGVDLSRDVDEETITLVRKLLSGIARAQRASSAPPPSPSASPAAKTTASSAGAPRALRLRPAEDSTTSSRSSRCSTA